MMFAHRMNVRLVTSLVLVASTAPAPAWANGNDSDDRAVSEGLEFAEGLASDWQFVDMALEVLDGVAAGELDSEQQRLVDLTRAKVFGAAAKNEKDDGRKEQLFTDALDRYRDFLERFADTDQGEDAKRSYVDLASEYGLFMEERLEEAGGDEAARIRDELDERLNKVSFFATETIVELEDQFDDLTQLERNELFKLMLAQGNLLLILGRVSDGGGESYLSNASETMEDLTFKAGPTTGFGLNAYHVLGRVEEARGRPEDAVDYYEYVATQVVPDDDEEWGTIRAENPESLISTLWAYYEREISWLVEAHLAAGQGERAVSRSLRFYNLYQREGFDLSPYGHQSMLAAARSLLETGGWVGGSAAAGELAWFPTLEALDEAGVGKRTQQTAAELALEMAAKVNEENRGNTLQIRAQRLISEVVDSGLEVTPAILFEAALGSYNSGNYQGAIDGLRLLVSRLDNETDRKLFMPKIQYYLGRSFFGMDRKLEAAMAFREGVDSWRGDEEWDPQNAKGFYGTMNQLRRELKDDEEIEALFRESEVLQSSIGEGAGGAIEWRRVQREYDAEQWESAREIALSIPEDSDYYEKAQVRAAACAYRMGDLDLAEGELEAYLNEYLEDPRNRLQSTEVQLIKLRSEAKAEAVYTLGQIVRERGDWEGVLARYETFAEDNPGQDSLTAATIFYRLEAAIELGNDELADELLELLVDEYADDPITGSAAGKLYNSYVGKHNDAEEGSAEQLGLKRKMAETLSLSNRLGGAPEFSALQTESGLWEDAQAWDKVEEVTAEVVDRYGDTGDVAELRALEKVIFPRRGKALLELRRITEAYEVLAPLVPNFADTETEKRASIETITSYARAVTGWLEGDGSSPTIVPGVGGAEPLENAAGWLEKIVKGQDPYSCEWYETNFLRGYALYQLGQADSSKRDWANKLMRPIQVEAGQTFRDVADKCGSDELQARYRWLMGKL